MTYSNHTHKNHYLIFGTADFKVGSHLNGRAHPLRDDLEALLSPTPKFNGSPYSLELNLSNINIGTAANPDSITIKAKSIAEAYLNTVFGIVSSPPSGAYYQLKSNIDGVIFYHQYSSEGYRQPKMIRSTATQKLSHKDKIELRFGDYSIFLIYLVQEKKKSRGLGAVLKSLIGR